MELYGSRSERMSGLLDQIELRFGELESSATEDEIAAEKAVAKTAAVRAVTCMLKRWPAFTRFLDDGRICLSNNAAERALRGIALGRKSWLVTGSDRGGQGLPPCTASSSRQR